MSTISTIISTTSCEVFLRFIIRPREIVITMVIVEILSIVVIHIPVILKVTGFKAICHLLQLPRINRSSILFLEGIVGI
jgi:hypothetical protein